MTTLVQLIVVGRGLSVSVDIYIYIERERETQTQKIDCLQVLKPSNNTAGTHSL